MEKKYIKHPNSCLKQGWKIKFLQEWREKGENTYLH